MRIYSLLLSSQNQCLFISIPYPNQAYDKQRKNHFSVVICVCVAWCSEMLWNSPFPRFFLYQEKFSCCQPWWWPAVNTSLISRFWKNVSSFNFLTNALTLMTVQMILKKMNLKFKTVTIEKNNHKGNSSRGWYRPKWRLVSNFGHLIWA